MAYQAGESLESWLHKATNPINRQEDGEYIIGFWDQINKEHEGPQNALTLLIPKISSQDESEALHALTILEACIKNCGRRFYMEVRGDNFLGYLVQMIHPQFRGKSTHEKVKIKILEMMYNWTIVFPNDNRMREIYQIVKIYGPEPELTYPPARPKHPVFDNEDMGKLLAELLQGKNPDDLQEANRLIKNMVKEDEARVQKVSNRLNTLEEVNINVKLLTEMLSQYNKNGYTDPEKEVIKELYERCENLRHATYKLATQTEDNDTSLGDIIQASDDLSRVISSYKKIVERQSVNSDNVVTTQPTGVHSEETTDSLIDLAGLDTPSPPQPAVPPSQSLNPDSINPIPFLPPPKRLAGTHGSQRRSPSQHPPNKASSALSLLGDKLLSLGLNETPLSLDHQSSPKLNEVFNHRTSLQAPTSSVDMFSSIAGSGPVVPPAEPSLQNRPDLAKTGFSDYRSEMTAKGSRFGITSGAALSLIPGQGSPSSASHLKGTIPSSPVLSHTKSQSLDFAPGSPLFRSSSPCHPPLQGSLASDTDISLSNVHVPLEAIRPSKVLPVTVYDKDGVRVLLNFAADCPAGRPDVLVMVVSMLNTAPLPVHSVVLQAAVPKSMKLKLQPPSGAELAPFNPIQPPVSITQIMLLANPEKEKVRLRYKLSFLLGDQLCSEVGEVNQFPPTETWGCL